MSRSYPLPLARLAATFAVTLLMTLLTTGCVLVPKRVAIMDFVNATNDHALDHLSVAIPETLITAMNRDPNTILILERQDINHYLEEIDRNPGPDSRVDRFWQLGKRLGADYFVIGSVARFGKRFTVQCRLFSVETGRLVPASAVARSCDREEDLFEVACVLGAAMVQQVYGRYPKTEAETQGSQPVLAPDPPPPPAPTAPQPSFPDRPVRPRILR